MTTPTNPTLKALCVKFVERSQALGLKGKRRDDAMLEYMIGATSALMVAGHPDADLMLRVCTMILSVRGFAEVERIAREGDRPHA